MHRWTRLQGAARRHAPPASGDGRQGIHPDDNASPHRAYAHPRVSSEVSQNRLFLRGDTNLWSADLNWIGPCSRRRALVVRYRDRRILSVSDFLEELRRWRHIRQPVWFRGLERADWGLAPTISRVTGGITAESPLITRFKQNALALVADRPGSEWEWLF